MTADLASFLTERLDEAQRRAENRLCIHCGNRTTPLRSALGIAGYTHDSRNPETGTRDGWEGQRCPGRITGAEPVQDPTRALRSITARRAILAEHQPSEHEHDGGRICLRCVNPTDLAAPGPFRWQVPWPCPTLRHLAGEYSDHPDWAPLITSLTSTGMAG